MTNAAPPLVTVIMPCRNGAATLQAAIASVQAQTLPNWELVFADDASTDASHAQATALANSDPRLIILPAPSSPTGAATARNRALAAAKGRYIAFLDVDDVWLSDKLAAQLDVMQRTQCGLAFGSYTLRRAGKPDRTITAPATVTYDDMLQGNKIGCLTAIYDTDKVGKVPMPPIKRRHDYALWLDILTRTSVAYAVLDSVAVHHRRAGSLSANIFKSTWGTWTMLRHTAGLSQRAALRSLGLHLIQRIFR